MLDFANPGLLYFQKAINLDGEEASRKMDYANSGLLYFQKAINLDGEEASRKRLQPSINNGNVK
jgi:hypothetical protein